MTELTDKPSDAQLALLALQTLVDFGLTGLQVKLLLDMPTRTLADVEAQLNATDETIKKLRDED